MSSFEEKYMKALRSIEQILKANKQIKEELDALRTMRQAEIDSCTNIQNEQFRKAYDALLQDKNQTIIANQTLELENQRMKYSLAELEQQMANNHKIKEEQNTPKVDKGEGREGREAQLKRTIENYEEHHATLQRNCRRLEQRNNQLEGKLTACEKSWRNKFEAKELEVVEVKARSRQEFGEQVSQLRKENAALKLTNSEVLAKLQNCKQGALFGQQLQSMDWESDLLREVTAMQNNLEPLRQQISELHHTDIYQRENAARERANLQARVLELEADVQRQTETIKLLEKRIIQGQEEKREAAAHMDQLRKLQEENQLLSGRIIVMESREVALRSRTGEELQERVLQFQNRIQLLLSNKEGLRELREVGIHQLIALKAYILQLDSRLKELLLSNTYVLKKYKSYKEKYQASLKENKQQAMTINTLRMKMMGYDKLVIKLQTELETVVRIQTGKDAGVRRSTEQTSHEDIFRRKYELMQEKLQIQEKYKSQEMETFKLNYQARIMELTIKVEEVKSLRETIELYRAKNEELQSALSKKETEIFESKVLVNSKVINSIEPEPPRKDMINTLHATLKQNDETIFRLQSELRNREETHKRTTRKLEKQLEDTKDQHKHDLARKELDFSMTLDQEVKKYRLRVAELEHSQNLTITDHSYRGSEETEQRFRNMQKRLEDSEKSKQEEIFNRRRLQKQILDLTQDRQDLQRGNNGLQLKLSQFRTLQHDYEELKAKREVSKKDSRNNHLDYQLQSKDAIIKQLNDEIFELKSFATKSNDVSTISSQKNDLKYLKNEIEDLKGTITQLNSQKSTLKTSLGNAKITITQLTNQKTSFGAKNKLSTDLENALQEKQSLIVRLRKDLSLKENKILQFEEQASKLTQQIRRFKRQLTQIDRLRYQNARLESIITDKDKTINQLRSQSTYDIQIDRIKQELTYVKENYQRVSYQLREKGDIIEKLNLDLTAANKRNNTQNQSRYVEELVEKEKQYNKIYSEYQALKSTLTITQQDRRYYQQSFKRANNDIITLKQSSSQLKQQNDNLHNQIYTINQQISQMRHALESYKGEAQDQRQREEENYRIKTEFFSLKSEISSLKDDIFSKQSFITRVNNENISLKSHCTQLQGELNAKQQQINRLTFEYNNIRDQYSSVVDALQQKDNMAQRLNSQLASTRLQLRQLDDEMEDRSQTFSSLTQEINKLKGKLAYYEQQIDTKTRENIKIANEKQMLSSQILNLNQILTEKHVEINKIRQQLMALRFESSERDYEEKIKIDRQIYAYMSSIASLQRDINDRDEQIRKMQEKISTRPQSPTIDFQAQQLRMELQRVEGQLRILKGENERYRNEQQIMKENIKSLKGRLQEKEEKLAFERQESQRFIAQANLREKRLREELQRISAQIQGYKQRIRMVSQIQRQFQQANEEIAARGHTIDQLSIILQSKSYQNQQLQSHISVIKQELRRVQLQYDLSIQQIHAKIIQQHQQTVTILQNKCQQYEVQLNHHQQTVIIHQNKCQQYQIRLSHAQTQIQQYQHQIRYLSQQREQFNRVQHNLQSQIQQIHINYRQQISLLRSQLQLQRPPISPSITNTLSLGVPPSPQDHSQLVHPYLEEIDRLNAIICQLEEDLSAFKLKLYSMISHENRIEQNLTNMVHLFNEVINIRQNIEVRETEIGEVRRSFVQKAASDGGSEKSSRILAQSGLQLSNSQELEGGVGQKKVEARGSLQGSQKQEGQPRGGVISIKIGSNNHYNSPIQSQSSSILQSQSIQSSSVQHYLTIQQQQPILNPQILIHGGSFNQTGGSGVARPANYILPSSPGIDPRLFFQQ